MKTIFDRNLNALKKKNRKLYNAAVNKECKKQEKIIRICKNEKKQDVLSVYKKEHLWYLSSRYDSEYAAEEWVKQFKDMHYKNIFIVYGMSQGDYIKSLQKVIGEDNKVIVYEPDENIYFSVINNVDITKWIADDRVQLYVGNINEDEFRLYFRYEIKYELLELTNVISSPNYAKVYCDEYEKFTSLIDNESRYVIGERQTLNVSGQEFGDNIIKNIWELAKGSSLYYLKDIINSKIECLDNIPAIIVSAGPSLDKNIDDIKLSKGKAFIVAVDSAINKLLEHDIEPDLLVTVDSHKPMNLFAKEKVKNMPLAVCGQSRHEVLRQHRGNRIVFAADYFYMDFFKKLKKILVGLLTGGSVANNSFSLVEFLGFKNIILVGQDLAFTDNKKHASNVYKESEIDIEKYGSSYTYVKDNNGNDILTFNNFKLYKEWFEARISDNKELNVINATEGGACIEGAKVLTLKNAISIYCKGEWNIDCNDDIPHMFDEKGLLGVYEKIEDIYIRLDKLRDNLNRQKTYYITLRENILKDSLKKEEYDDLVGKIKECDVYNDNETLMQLLSLYSNKEESDICDTIYKDDAGWKGVYNTIAYSIKLIDVYIRNIQVIKKQLDDVTKDEIELDIKEIRDKI